MNGPVVVGSTVRRPAGPWTPTVHALLRHFERVGFDGAPRALGIDDEGHEILSHVEGDVPSPGATPPGDEVVFAVGELLRAAHDAQAGFIAPSDAEWQVLPGAVPGDEVVCHNDPLGTNFVFRQGRPVALIDWELAAPGLRLADVAAAAAWWVPLRPDESAQRYRLPTTRRAERLRLLADGYGLDAADRLAVLSTVRRVAVGWYEAYRVLGAVERRAPWAARWDAGRGVLIRRHVRWLDAHRRELEAWLH